MSRWLVGATFFAASGGILYEIFLGALGSYLFGDSIRVFSLTMGLYMFSMGAGAFAIRPPVKRPLGKFLATEALLMALHVVAPFLIWGLFVLGWGANLTFWICLIVSGFLVGTEIPLLLAIAREKEGTSDARIHQVLAADYFGALVASLLFGFWLMPREGLIATAAFAAVLEGVAVLSVWIGGRRENRGSFEKRATAAGLALLVPCLLLFLGSDRIQGALEKKWVEESLFGRLLDREWTGYNHVALVEIPVGPMAVKQKALLLNGQYQWASGSYMDSYHDSLLIPAAELFRRRAGRPPEKALVLGGGDGFVAARLRQFYGTRQIQVLELDQRIVELARSVDYWREAGGAIFDAEGVKARFGDAYQNILSGKVDGPNDTILFDLPVPTTPALARFFTPGFLARVSRLLSEEGVISIQSSSRGGTPMGRERFVCSLEQSLRAAGLRTLTLVGVDQDFYTIASRQKFSWPEPGEGLPGKFLASGAGLRALASDPWDRFGDRCPPLPQHTLLRPVLLEF
jgi:spermidine synthase